jgi:hypothetical protein
MHLLLQQNVKGLMDVFKDERQLVVNTLDKYRKAFSQLREKVLIHDYNCHQHVNCVFLRMSANITG